MESILSKKLVWWRDVPVDVEMGLLEYLRKVWNNHIYVICANDFDSSRRICSWKNASDSKLTYIVGETEIANNQELIDCLINDSCIHIFSGVKGGHRKFLDRLKANPSAVNSCVLVSESPSLYGNPFVKLAKALLYPIVYGYNRKKYSKLINSIFVMGRVAQEQYISFGWKSDFIYPFMYLPENQIIFTNANSQSDTTKLLYIGRFNYATKGVDCLIKAIDHLSVKANWQLDMVGGYGENAKEIINWCENTPNVNFVGACNHNEIIQKMSEYDICVVPSAYDGWNMAPQQSINAGIACVVSDNAGSQELIEKSQSGAVFHAGNHQELKTILEKAISDITIIQQWHNNAILFRENISVEIVGEYFVDALKYSFGESTQKPICPWLGE